MDTLVRPVSPLQTLLGGPLVRMPITGGSRFISSNLSKPVLSNDFGVTILDPLLTGCSENIQELTFIQALIFDAEPHRKPLTEWTR